MASPPCEECAALQAAVSADQCDDRHAEARRQLCVRVEGHFRDWLRSRGFPDDPQRPLAVAIATGSTMLGVCGPDSDLDLSLLVSEEVPTTWLMQQSQRAADANSNTFDRWLAQQPGVLSVRALPKAHAPIVQAVLDGDPQPIDVDIGFCSLQRGTIFADLDLLGDEVLDLVRPEGVQYQPAALNAVRVNRALVSAAVCPDLPCFRLVLRTLRLWAKRRGIYGKGYGCFGGVVWAIVAAWGCQAIPNGCPHQVVDRLFQSLADGLQRLSQPADLVIEVRHVPTLRYPRFPEWHAAGADPKVPQILTPCRPVMNVAYDVTRSAFDRIREECTRAHQLRASRGDWALLAQPYELNARHCLRVSIAGPPADTNWTGFVRSKLCRLVKEVEPDVPSLEEYHPLVLHPKEFVRTAEEHARIRRAEVRFIAGRSEVNTVINGRYSQFSLHQDHVVYRKGPEPGCPPLFLFRVEAANIEPRWVVGEEIGSHRGRRAETLGDDLLRSPWQVWDGKAWKQDPNVCVTVEHEERKEELQWTDWYVALDKAPDDDADENSIPLDFHHIAHGALRWATQQMAAAMQRAKFNREKTMLGPFTCIVRRQAGAEVDPAPPPTTATWDARFIRKALALRCLQLKRR
eukprot:EG_transcript_6384